LRRLREPIIDDLFSTNTYHHPISTKDFRINGIEKDRLGSNVVVAEYEVTQDLSQFGRYLYMRGSVSN